VAGKILILADFMFSDWQLAAGNWRLATGDWSY
jgi:hypothetical protein